MNPWREFQGLLPESPLLIVEVVEHNPDGTSTVELPGGQRFRARGQGVAVGAFAFVH